jgi:hypothetical protein
MNKPTIKAQSLALAQECERLARESERLMISPSLTEEGRKGETEKALVYWQLAQAHTQSALYAEQVRPTRFTGQAKGDG